MKDKFQKDNTIIAYIDGKAIVEDEEGNSIIVIFPKILLRLAKQCLKTI